MKELFKNKKWWRALTILHEMEKIVMRKRETTNMKNYNYEENFQGE